MDHQAELNVRLNALGPNPTDDQKEDLVDWILFHAPYSQWDQAAEIALAHGLSDVYTDLRMHVAES